MANKKFQQPIVQSDAQLSKDKSKNQEQAGIHDLTNATTISLMMREANRSAHIDMKIIEQSLRQDKNK